MYKYIYCYLFLFGVLCGCANRHGCIVDADAVCMTINPDDSKRLDMETLFSSVDVIPLESSTASLFSRCDKMIFYEGKYYILDKKAACIFIFDEDGTFLRSSKSKQGHGPGEYYCIVDFEISKDGHIEILDVSAYKIRKYDDKFNFIGEVDIPRKLYPISTFKCLNDGLYAFYSPRSSKTNDQITVYSFKQNRIVESVKGYISISSLKVGTTQSYSFYESGEDVFFSFPYPNDKVYKIDRNEGSISETVRYDFGNYSFPFEELDSHAVIFEDIIKGSKNYAFPIYRGENKDFLFTFIMYQGKQSLFLYDKVSRRSNLYSCQFHDGKVLLPPTFVDDNYWYIVAERGWLEYMVTEKLSDEKAKEAIKKIQEEDNPVILKYSLRK